jgi:starch phosphorylase
MELAMREGGEDLALYAKGFEVIDRIDDQVVWDTRRRLRAELVEEVRRRLRVSWLQRGASAAELGWIDGVFDPDVLTIGFARRVPSYKRLTLMLHDRERLTRILTDPDRPVQMVIAGKAHPADDGGKQLVQQIVQFSDQPDVRQHIVFLPDYDIGMAKYLYAGCDVWLNNPLRPLEACGTSGMKSALNGGLNLSIRDGWWDEMYDGQNGWAIPSADGVVDPDRRDELESQALYQLLEENVAARFYESGRRSTPPPRWVRMVKHTLMSLGPQVLATRMVRDYVKELYAPAARASERVTADNCAGAKDLAGWQARVSAAWPRLRVINVDSSGLGDTPQVGSELTIRVSLDLGDLGEDDVDVQVAYGPVDESDRLVSPRRLSLASQGSVDGGVRYEGTVTLDRAGAFGYAVRVLPAHAMLGSGAELGLVASA